VIVGELEKLNVGLVEGRLKLDVLLHGNLPFSGAQAE
jgi:hypothetical protein